MKWQVLMLATLLCLPSLGAQDIGGALGPVDDALGDTVPPALGSVYAAAGQNITREDVRMFLDINFTKADVALGGLLVGSGRAEVEANLALRVEMRVISSDRIRAAAEGENAYNISAENGTFLTEAYLPAEVFRASLTAEAMAQFQQEQEAALQAYIEETVPELELLRLDITWSNTQPQMVVEDTSLTDPPIVVELAVTIRYLRTESVGSLLAIYTDREDKPEDPKKAKIQELKEENSDPLRARDFFAAAAYTQLTNLSMQPGWSLHVDMRVPRGFSFEYANKAIERHDARHISFQVDALEADEETQEVYVVSLTQRRAVALALFGAMMAIGALVVGPSTLLYNRFRLSRLQDRQE